MMVPCRKFNVHGTFPFHRRFFIVDKRFFRFFKMFFTLRNRFSRFKDVHAWLVWFGPKKNPTTLKDLVWVHLAFTLAF